ncbi:hypothetical protein PNA2_0952 [Pyrococcus sp. NA2]|uniref:methyltransferase n=1 Tax=Pyrococcus sp. (strain NA2) TaxID=342949 RepID=UPI000209A91F|nr:methyltransferase [Pyrococcus sp. NA2]AEC51868.1 hypothetical protein PNA2_0952 [Pyrococcus sp. NA2]
MKKNVAYIVLALLVLFNIKIGISNFMDVAKSQGNLLSSGEFDIRISKDGNRFYNDLKLVNIRGLKPGDVKEFTLYVKNYGDIPVSNLSLIIYVRDYEEELSPAEKPYDLTDEEGELSKCLYVEKILVNGTNILSEPVRLSEIAGKEVKLYSGSLREKDVIPVKFEIRFPESSGNECMTDATEMMIKIVGTQ